MRQQPIEEMHVLRKNSREMHKMNMGAGEEWTLKDHVEALELELSYPINRIHSAIFGIRVVTGQGKQFGNYILKERTILYCG